MATLEDVVKLDAIARSQPLDNSRATLDAIEQRLDRLGDAIIGLARRVDRLTDRIDDPDDD